MSFSEPQPEPLVHAASLCHRCRACRSVVSGRGSVFLLCTARPAKYLPQPMRRCPVFDPAAHVLARGADGKALIRWWGEPVPAALTVVADGRGGLRGALPAGRSGVSPGHGLMTAAEGAAWVPTPGAGMLLGWVLAGAEWLVRCPDGAEITLEPVALKAS